MGLGTYGFVKGFTSDMRDSIDKREEADRDRKKTVFLEELRRDTYKWQKDLDEIYDAKKPNKDMEQIDYTKGTKILKNSKGETISEIPLTKSEMEDYDLDVRGKRAQTSSLETKSKYAEQEIKAGLARDYASIDASRASAESSRTNAGLARRQAAALDGSGKTPGSALDDRAAELLYQNKAVQEDLIRAGVPAEAVSELAVEVLAELNARGAPPQLAQQTFLKAAAALRNTTRNSQTYKTK